MFYILPECNKSYLYVCCEVVRATVLMLQNALRCYNLVRKYQCLTTVVCVCFSHKLNFNFSLPV